MRSEPIRVAYAEAGAGDEQNRRRGRGFMRVLAQLAIAAFAMAASVVGVAFVGGAIGRYIAVNYPRYYPSVFPTAATQPQFNPMDVGVATGIGQGAALGAFVGVALVFALAIANRPKSTSSPH